MIYISMSQGDLSKYEVIKRSLKKDITVEKAAELLDLSERQIYNLRAAVKEDGAEGLIHGNRGRVSNRRMPENERQEIVRFLRERYSDFRPTHASEKLREIHGLNRDPKTIRLIMTTEGLWRPKRHKKPEYRASRPPKEHYGEMQQFDGSYHRWFEERAPEGCLLASIDDATGRITQAQFAEHEGVFPVFGFWQEYLLSHGKPCSIYLDKLRTYYNNILPAPDEEILTQFQRAMRELDVEPIVAHSPQAKGRIERLFKTLQDRLIKELRLRNISDVKTANQYLRKEFIPWFNSVYGRDPLKKANLHHKLDHTERVQLPAVFSRQSARTVQNDFTFRFNNQWYQLIKEQPATIRPQDRVTIEERLDGQIYIRLRGKYLNYQILPAKSPHSIKPFWVIAASQKPERGPYKPPAGHPWRRPFLFNHSRKYQISSQT